MGRYYDLVPDIVIIMGVIEYLVKQIEHSQLADGDVCAKVLLIQKRLLYPGKKSENDAGSF